jgi:Kef-type K+ transport system membrane component KefB
MGGGNLVAWLALVISAATIVWKFVETYIRWPRIGVVMRQHITIHVGSIPSAEVFG